MIPNIALDIVWRGVERICTHYHATFSLTATMSAEAGRVVWSASFAGLPGFPGAHRTFVSAGSSETPDDLIGKAARKYVTYYRAIADHARDVAAEVAL